MTITAKMLDRSAAEVEAAMATKGDTMLTGTEVLAAFHRAGIEGEEADALLEEFKRDCPDGWMYAH